MLPSGAPMERDARLQRLFYLLLRVPSKGALPSGSPTGSLWREIFRLQSHWSISSFMSARAPQKEPS